MTPHYVRWIPWRRVAPQEAMVPNGIQNFVDRLHPSAGLCVAVAAGPGTSLASRPMHDASHDRHCLSYCRSWQVLRSAARSPCCQPRFLPASRIAHRPGVRPKPNSTTSRELRLAPFVAEPVGSPWQHRRSAQPLSGKSCRRECGRLYSTAIGQRRLTNA